MNIHLHTADKENPFIEFVSPKGTRAALNLRMLADMYAGHTLGKALQECLEEIRESLPEGDCIAIITGVELICRKHLAAGPLLVHAFRVSVNADGRAIIDAECPLCHKIGRAEFFS